MTDIELLDKRIESCGYRYDYIAEQLGITRTTLRNKRIGKSEFTASEIRILSSLLHIDSSEEIRQIFLNQKLYEMQLLKGGQYVRICNGAGIQRANGNQH